MRTLFLVAALGLFIGGSCASDPDEDSPDVFVFTLNDQCRAPLRNGLAAEDTCTLPDDCAEVCCGCQASTRAFSAQACVAGKCPTKEGTCAHAEQVTEICIP
jgi:hypothetical protein